MKMEQTECSEMSAYKIHYPEESIQDSKRDESLKSRIQVVDVGAVTIVL